MAMLHVNLNNILGNSIWNQFLMFRIMSWQDKSKSHGNVKQNTALLKSSPTQQASGLVMAMNRKQSHGNA